MKKIKLLSFFVMLFTAFVFTSCQTEGVDSNLLDQGEIDNPGNPAEASFHVDFNGSTYQATTATALAQGGVILISGMDTGGRAFTLSAWVIPQELIRGQVLQ